MQKEAKSAFILSLIMAFRMLGLFMILPVFTLYAHQLTGSTASLIGIALGIYGLTQAALQIPFGLSSDKFGRKPIIILGLLLFIAGSVVAALSHSIDGVIIGRALQGGGAIGSTALALLADLTRDETRTRAMAFMGMTIGLSFAAAMVLGPIIDSAFQLSGIFWVTAILGVLAIVMLGAVPKAPKAVSNMAEPKQKRLRAALKNGALLRMNFSIFIQHATLTVLFLGMPSLLKHHLGLSSHGQTLFYLIVLFIAFFAMVPLIIIGEKKHKLKQVLVFSVALMAISQFLIPSAGHHVVLVGLLVFLFFTAFTNLEATLPSLVSKIAPIQMKGTAMGIYSSSQFFGIFVGGLLGGLTLAHFGLHGTFILGASLCVLWLLVLLPMKQPPYLSTVIVKREQFDANLQHKLQSTDGVAELAWSQEEGLLYVKINRQKISKDGLHKVLEQGNLSE